MNKHLREEHTSDAFPDSVSGHSLRCICDHCDNEFRRVSSQIANNQYCSRECAKEGRRGEDVEYGPKFRKTRDI